MGITVDEKKLSSAAKRALANAKNKSQFIRDALESYVRGNSYDINNDDYYKEIKQDLKTILALLTIQQTQQKHQIVVPSMPKEEQELKISPKEELKEKIEPEKKPKINRKTEPVLKNSKNSNLENELDEALNLFMQ